MLVFAKTGSIILGTGDVFGRGRVGSQKDLRGSGVRELKKGQCLRRREIFVKNGLKRHAVDQKEDNK
jgi:hypothetical protein